MKLVMDEKLKHRLIGLAVIISLGAIFAPAVMKKSSQNVDGNFSVNVKLPPKPISPNVVMTDEKEMFNTIKVAKVALPDVPNESPASELVKAEPIKSDLSTINQTKIVEQVESDVKAKPIQLALNQAAKDSAKKTITVASIQPAKSVKPVKVAQAAAKKPKAIAKVINPARAVKVAKAKIKPAIKKDIYALQLASFSQISNAQALVNRLKSRGYKANFAKVSGRNGAVYKVYVGHSPRKNEVLKLKTQLASAMQLSGFVVNTGVS